MVKVIFKFNLIHVHMRINSQVVIRFHSPKKLHYNGTAREDEAVWSNPSGSISEEVWP